MVDITRRQMDSLCGNALELEDGRGNPVLALSSQAFHAFTEDQRRQLRRHVAALHHAPIDTLEFIGGGSLNLCCAVLCRPLPSCAVTCRAVLCQMLGSYFTKVTLEGILVI